MNVLIVTREQFNDRHYGLGKAMSQIASGLRSRNHAVTYCSAADWGAPEHAYFERLSRRLEKIFYWCGINSELASPWAERMVQGKVAQRRALECGASHIWFQDPWLATAYHWQYLFGGKTSPATRWGISEHGLGSFARAVGFDGLKLNSRTLRLLTWLERRILKQAHWVFIPSHVAMNALCRDVGSPSPAKNWHVLGYGAPEPLSETRAKARETLGWDHDAHYLLAIGRVSPVKKMHLLVEACAVAQKSLSTKLQLVLLGDGDRTLLEQAKNAFNYEYSIQFTEDVRTYLAAADGYLSASQAESFGLANQEAVSAGLPCLIACGGAACEVVGRGAWLLDGTVEAFSDAILVILTEPAQHEFWAARAKQTQWPTWDSIVDECESYLGGRHE